ncbi:tripartite tricarboxylate transporter substrate binding protein [Marispirochaeta sp.]|uniref:Bug family tripartite tricarboxylate transporter substrate binding protein n=1 Tax=Marispirochaeta sp. TaxID=2038653 RepID=UPI0029C8DF7C|nr:tripartite tricarboxylate transporter substrate binding protein [Marispirochaeta sp.]
MKKSATILLCLLAAASMLTAEGNPEKETEARWPQGPVQIIVGARAGGGTDLMARIFSDYLQRELGSPVVVVNQPAGGGTVAYEQVRTAKPDGQTLLFMHTGMLIYNHTGRYDHPVSDFTTIAIAQSYPPQVYAVAPDTPWDNMKDFVDDARRNPGKRTVGVALGGATHFIAGTIMMEENVELKLVEAASEVDKVAAIQGGHIDIGNLGSSSAAQYEQAGKMKVLCLIDPDPDPKYPQFVPAIDQGLNFSWIAPLVVWGPKGMDPAIVEKINTATRNMGTDPGVQEQLNKMSSAYTYYTVQEAQELIYKEDEKIAALADKLGLATK